jgi:hypothetical protein
VRTITIVSAITGVLAIAAPARAEQYKCNPFVGPYPGYTAYAPSDCGGFRFYLAPTFHGYGYPEYRVQTPHKRAVKPTPASIERR